MDISEKGIDFIKEVEGFKNRVYKDSAGLPTIGVGHLLTQDELTSGKILISYQSVRYKDGLTDDQVEQLLRQDLQRFVKAVNDAVRVRLTQNEFDALVSFAFNVGVGAFKSSTLLKRVNAVRKDKVPYELSRWVYSGGERIPGLINRRNKEAELWSTPYEEPQSLVYTAPGTSELCHYQGPNGEQKVVLKGTWALVENN